MKRDGAEHYADHVVYKRHSLHKRTAKSAETAEEKEEQRFCGVGRAVFLNRFAKTFLNAEAQSQERSPRSEDWEDAGINAGSVRDLAVIAKQLTQESTLDVS